MRILIVLAAFVFATLLISGCAKQQTNNVVDECKAACSAALTTGQNLSNGPCLLDPMSNPYWVCDITHSPRESIDDLPENQCNAWNNKTASHFIELTPECIFIKTL
jgi:hypothetical protein